MLIGGLVSGSLCGGRGQRTARLQGFTRNRERMERGTDSRCTEAGQQETRAREEDVSVDPFLQTTHIYSFLIIYLKSNAVLRKASFKYITISLS